MKVLKPVMIAAATVAMSMLPFEAATAYYGMYGPGWDYPTGIWTPGKQRMIERRRALREWWQQPEMGLPYGGYGRGLHRGYGPYRGYGNPWSPAAPAAPTGGGSEDY
jgi:hypothetical protein